MNLTRVILILLAVASSTVAFVQWLSDDFTIELQSTLLTVAADILVLLRCRAETLRPAAVATRSPSTELLAEMTDDSP